MNRTDLAYRKTAVEGASGFGLLISLYDTLAGNLRRAAAAQRANDIEGRCREAKHALMVIGYLEDCLHRSDRGPLTDQLETFYSSLRRRLMDAQVRQAAEVFEREMDEVLKIREEWQQIDQQNRSIASEVPSVTSLASSGYAPMQNEGRFSGWSV